jgi:glycosyltransferase involved in cell wall biosynthesis
MRISVVIACLDSAPVIDRCLESIAIQSYPDIEVVVSDGGSTDGTIERLIEHERKMAGRLEWRSERDRGIADAWNKAVARCTGDWLLFLGADDALEDPDVISRAASHLREAFPDHRVVYGNVTLCDSNQRPIATLEQPWSPAEFRNCRRCLPHQAVFHHRSLFVDHGSFDTSLRIVSDYDFLLRELMKSAPLHVPELFVTQMQIGGISNDRAYSASVVREQICLFRRHVGGTPLLLRWWLLKATIIRHLHKIGGDRLALFATNAYRRIAGGRPPLPF